MTAAADTVLICRGAYT